jgi:threonylcarbamoyladenosine tRNA methylthiotransferase MtaB
MTAQVLTFGCRLNAHESEIIAGLIRPLDDLVVVNGCAVTTEAERQARQAIRRIRRERPGARIAVTGCAAQIAPAQWATLPGVTRVVGNAEKLRPEAWGVAPAAAPPAPARARALVQVQQGCDHRCTFCIIPLGRGANRSLRPDDIVSRVRALVAAGTQEVVLTGVDIASYGMDMQHGPGLGRMIAGLLAAVPTLPRLRLSSLDPAALDDDLFRLIAGEPRFMPHLHLSMQSACPLILKRMRRRHSPDQVSDAIARARSLRPELAIGADFIAGFPTETDAFFEATLDWVLRHALPYLHVFPYSERPGTPAARMPPVPHAVRRERAARLRAAGRDAALAWHRRQVGQTVEVLTEAGGGGHTPAFAPVRLPRELPPGRLLPAKVTAADAEALTVALGPNP